MADCEICGSLRLNGTAIVKRGKVWETVKNPNPVDPKVNFACRSCAKEKLRD